MASNTKYHAAPTVDPDDHADYTQAPPSYQAEASTSAANDEARLFGGVPRGSQDGDDVPDDFKYGGYVAEASVEIRHQFIRKVYAILSLQLLVTAAASSVSFMNDSYKQWIQTNVYMVYISMFGAIGFMLLTYWKRKSYPTNLLFLSAFTLSEAYMVSVIVSLYDVAIVLNAVFITAGIFVFLTAFSAQTKYDFSSWQPYLFGALWGLVLFSFAFMFMPASKTTDLVFGLVSALIFSGYILFDTQMVLRKHHVEEEIAAAISLYLDIINLFLAILRILNSQSNN